MHVYLIIFEILMRLTSSLPCEQMAGQDRQACTKFGQ